MLRYRPNTVSVEAASENFSGGVASIANFAAAASVRCQVTPLATDVAFNTFSVETTAPILILANVADAAKFTVSSKVTYAGSVYRVVANPRVWNAEPRTSCIEVIADLQKVDR